MNVQELRESEHIESVENGTLYEWSGVEYWFAEPNQDSYNTQEGVEFLTSLNVMREEGSTLVIPKGQITK